MSDQRTPEQWEAQRREMYISRLLGGSTDSYAKQVATRIYDRIGQEDIFESFVERLEQTGRIGEALSRSFTRFNWFVAARCGQGDFDMPQNMPYLYAQAIEKGKFGFEDFEPEVKPPKEVDPEDFDFSFPGENTLSDAEDPDATFDPNIGVIEEKKD